MSCKGREIGEMERRGTGDRGQGTGDRGEGRGERGERRGERGERRGERGEGRGGGERGEGEGRGRWREETSKLDTTRSVCSAKLTGHLFQQQRLLFHPLAELFHACIDAS